MTQPRALRLEIGALAVNGFSPGDSRRVAAGFQDELARMQLTGVPEARAELTLSAARANSPERIGAAAARALFEALEP